MPCKPETGVCEIAAGEPNETQQIDFKSVKPIKVVYFTDPICSACWGLEPLLRKLKLEYGHILDVEYHMGGLLKDWSYNKDGISSPSDVAKHWEEASETYDMPMLGDVMLDDPIMSSYPPSIAFKAAQIKSEATAINFLRTMREMLYLEKKNIEKWEFQKEAAQRVGLDISKLQKDMELEGKTNFENDLKLRQTMQVRGLPTLFFINSEGKSEIVFALRPYSFMEKAVLKVYPDTHKQQYDTSWQGVFSVYPTLTSREFAELTDTDRIKVDAVLQELVAKGELSVFTTRNGNLYIRK